MYFKANMIWVCGGRMSVVEDSFLYYLRTTNLQKRTFLEPYDQ